MPISKNQLWRQRCQAVNQAINEHRSRCLFNQLHRTWRRVRLTEERILGLDDISTWSNENRLPLFMTATREFSRYDDPSRNLSR